MALSFKNFKPAGIVNEGGQFLFVARYLREFLSMSDRTFAYAVARIDDSNKIVRSLGTKKSILLTVNGVKEILARSRLKGVSNAAELRKEFDELYVNTAPAPVQLDAGLEEDPTHEGSCIYLLELEDQAYKFGETDDLKRRLGEHRRTLDYKRVVQIFPCDNKTVARDAEHRIKEIMKNFGLLHKLPRRDACGKNHTEIIKSALSEQWIIDSIDNVVKTVHRIYIKSKIDNHDDALIKIIDRQQKQDETMAQIMSTLSIMVKKHCDTTCP